MDKLKNIMEKPWFFRASTSLTGSAVYVLVNERGRKVLVVAAVDFWASLARNINLIARAQHGSKQLVRARNVLKVKVLETGFHPSLCELKKAAYVEQYKKLGYSIYNLERVGSYTVRVGFSFEGRPQVQVVSKGKRVWGGREFSTLEEAEEYVATCTLDQAVIDIKERRW